MTIAAPTPPGSAVPARSDDRQFPFTASTGDATIVPLQAVPPSSWRDLHECAIERNAYYDPLWAVPVATYARGRTGAGALLAWDQQRLIGLMPARWSWAALSLPGPLLVGWSGYAPLSTPTLDRDHAVAAASLLIEQARRVGARAVLLPSLAIDRPAFAALRAAIEGQGLRAEVLRSYRRAALDATKDGETTLREALGAKKLKELRRQRHRLEDSGPLIYSVADSVETVPAALEDFLALEASGWKGKRGTALAQHPGDAAFIRTAGPAMAAQGRFAVVGLKRNDVTLASGLVLRDGAHAYFFKVAMMESEARNSPGVQLTLDLTRSLCADSNVDFADSSTDFVHPMIDHIWRERIEIADVFIGLRRSDPVATALRFLVQGRYRAIDAVRAARRIRERMP